jgi:hypothetical protein
MVLILKVNDPLEKGLQEDLIEACEREGTIITEKQALVFAQMLLYVRSEFNSLDYDSQVAMLSSISKCLAKYPNSFETVLEVAQERILSEYSKVVENNVKREEQ